MDFDEVLHKRRSIHSYQNIPIEKEQWEELLFAGQSAPSCGNIQNVKFTVYTKSDAKDKIVSCCNEQVWMKNAPLFILVTTDTDLAKKFYGIRGEMLYAVQNAAASTQNILLKAVDLGLGACWVSSFNEKKLKDLLGIPSKHRPQAIITVGYANETLPRPPMREPRELFYIDEFGGETDQNSDWVKRRNISDVRQTVKKSNNKFWEDIKEKFKK